MKTIVCSYCGKTNVVTDKTTLAICQNPGCKKMIEATKENK